MTDFREHLVIEIHGKQLPYNAALGCDPFFKLIIDGKKGKETVVYSSETVKNSFDIKHRTGIPLKINIVEKRSTLM